MGAKRKYNFDTSDYRCQNKNCKQYIKENKGHIRFAYYTKNKIAYLKCKVCNKIFSKKKGTIFFRRRYSSEKITQVIQSLGEGMGIRSASRVFGVTVVSILDWAKLGAKQVEEIEKKF